MTGGHMTIPATRKRVTKPAEDRRREIADAAARVFARKGVGGTTVADIAEAAGVAKGTVYLYYESKEHLLGALQERHADELVRRTTEHMGSIGNQDIWTLADAFVETMIDLELEQRDIVQVLCQEGFSQSGAALFADAERKALTMIAAGIGAGVEAGKLRCSDPEITASMLMHAVAGTIEHSILYGQEIDRDRLVAAATELVHKALSRF
jgi:AcrR family transcriptional regulator